ncbi:hypothetical protein HRI_003841600 [Hibiscus trionum]|uniref:FAR1 domain-containing protein n=1 Tax=Hibiscus trionum TaxID=183268 RepID=A0A9W7IXI2_HIBTR|nr:hypothetical protein HRI_003841600 [Hibiscus trionum]
MPNINCADVCRLVYAVGCSDNLTIPECHNDTNLFMNYGCFVFMCMITGIRKLVLLVFAVEKESLMEHIVVTESCFEGESSVSEADKNKEDKLLIIESSIDGESGAIEVNKNKEEKVLVTESYAGHESELCEPDLNQEPHVGMIFESAQAAKAFYDEYARRVGFSTRIVSSHKSELDGSIVHRRLACNKEGFNQNRQKSTRARIRKRQSKREGCMARMNVKQDKSGRYVISKIVKEHNHPLIVTSSKDHDGKDKKIQALSSELNQANEELVLCREQLCAIMASIEEHTNHLSKTIDGAVRNIKEVESRDHCSHNL